MIILLGHVLRFIVVLLLVRFVLRFVAAVVRGYREPRPEKVSDPPRATELVRDVVCNTYLPRDRALVAVVRGRQEHFCSPACRDRALKAAS